MPRILVPIDGSDCSLRALKEAVRMAQYDDASEVHLLNVQIPIVSGHARLFLDKDEVQSYYRSEGKTALDRAVPEPERAGVKYTLETRVGQSGETIADYADEKRCDHIVMGTRGLGEVAGLLLGSVARKVIHLSSVPVTLVK